MRRYFLLWLLFFAFVQAQGQAVLSSIDTLMQTRPDSALTCLMACYDTVGDRHYANLLLAELLYKNDYEQTNRAELQAAVVYYDSVFDPFLAARAHYINGVGYYERDSVVPACEQYLKAVEIMEEHFTEKELVGQKAKFMALVHTRLTDVFSDQYLHRQAIFFAHSSLPYYQKSGSSLWQVSRMLKEIGLHYDMMGQFDSAGYYYDKAMDFMSDTNELLYRDIATVQAFLSYKIVMDAESSLKRLKELGMLSGSPRERLSRCAIIGEIYFHEKMYDSAWKYLDSVFYSSPSVASKKQAAELLAEMCELQGRETDLNVYATFLIPFANQEENGSTLRSKLMTFYDSFQQKKLEKDHQKNARKNTNLILVFGCCFIVAIIVVFIFYRKRINAHKIQQAALSGRLRKSNEALRNSLETIKKQETELKIFNNEKPIGDSVKEQYATFIQTDICQEIVATVNKLHSDKLRPLKSNIDVNEYKSFSLSIKQQAKLLKTFDEQFPYFFASLKTLYPSFDRKDSLYCVLCLLGIDKMSICVLLQESYHTCRRLMIRLEKAFKCHQHLVDFLIERLGLL